MPPAERAHHFQRATPPRARTGSMAVVARLPEFHDGMCATSRDHTTVKESALELDRTSAGEGVVRQQVVLHIHHVAFSNFSDWHKKYTINFHS
jgi:hypothetical protein